MVAAEPHGRGKGAALLIEHCAGLARLEDCRPSPYERLEALVGVELAHMLVYALATDRGAGMRYVACLV
ncbi:MAG: hypothetical protein ACRDN6_00025 [Gaiellaceae bacterium]